MNGFANSPIESKCAADFVIVGGGTCGCWLAAELVERFGFRVTIIESGAKNTSKQPGDPVPDVSGTGLWAPIQRQPVKWIRELGGPQDWGFQAEPSDALAGRSLVWPRGRGMGGSSRINAMIWTLPTPQDLSLLQQAGGEATWPTDQLISAFQHAESIVRPEKPRFISESTRLFLQSAERFSRESEPGHCPFVYRRTNRLGRRWTAADRLLELPKALQQRLHCVQGDVKRLLLEDNTVRAVELDSSGESHSVTSRLGVILCGGAIASPWILQRSGVGNLAELERVGMPGKVDVPRVGFGLKDHLLMPVVYRRKDSKPFGGQFTPRDLARWMGAGRGPVVSNLAEAGGLFDDNRIQFHVTPTHYLTYPRKITPSSMTLGVNLTRPKSTGRVAVGRDGAVQIQPGYHTVTEDLEGLVGAIELAREIAASDPLAGALAEELIPGRRKVSGDRLVSAIGRYAQTLYHPVGTCAMGQSQDSVVDQNLRLRNMDRLWVVDASVLPEMTTTNPTGTLLALTTHAAGLIHRFVSPSAIP